MNLVLTFGTAALNAGIPDGIWVRPGYELAVAVDSIQTPRFLAFGNNGELFVSVPNKGTIYLCRDVGEDGGFKQVNSYIEGKKPGSESEMCDLFGACGTGCCR